MEDRWQLEGTNGSSEEFVFSMEGETQEGTSAAYRMGTIYTCSVRALRLARRAGSSPGTQGRGRHQPLCSAECGCLLLR